ncbi:MAG: AAA family ATPase [Alphaproteobacteria bacterium]|nr:AAA family ATPase [Alphaproteobacteria bacterium]
MTSGDKKKLISASDLTRDDLLAMLACGETLGLADGTAFTIEDETARKALSWFLGDPVGKRYLENAPTRGSGDMAGLVTWMEKGTLPAKPAVSTMAGDKRLWALVSLTVRQFGGLQPFCLADGSDAPDISLDISRPLFLAQGPNGAGKSSLARVLTFLLTGKVASTPEFQHFADAGQVNTYEFDDGSKAPLPSVVPMPTQPQWQARQAKGLPSVVTSVTAVFKADDGTKRTVCRRVKQVKTVFFTVLEADDVPVVGEFSAALGVSALAVELSALHMARLAHLELGKREPLADGIRALTGLREVAALAEVTAPKVKDYVGTNYAKSQRELAKAAEKTFQQQIDILAESFKDAVSPPMPSVPVGDGSACRGKLTELEKDLDGRASKVRVAVATAAGIEENKVELDGLDDDLIKATSLLTDQTLNSAGLAALAAAAAALSEEDVRVVGELLDRVVKRANDFAALNADELKTRRRRHHARIAAGLKEDEQAIPPADCPTCLRSLDDSVLDDVLGMPVAVAIAAGAEETDDLRFTLDQFIEAARTDLRDGLPEAVTSCVKLWEKLPGSPSPAAWAASVVANVGAALAGFPALKHLRALADKGFEADAAALPACPVSVRPPLDPIFVGTRVETAGEVLTGLLDLRDWALSTWDTRAKLVNQAYGVGLETILVSSLAGKINELRALLNDYRPVSAAKKILTSLRSQYDAWTTANKAAEAAVAAAQAVGELVALKKVVDVQVNGLFRDLNADMERYWRTFYQAPGHAGPEAGLVLHDGFALQIPATLEGVKGSANNIANSSQVRALLFSFVLALLRSVWKRSGGLTLVLLDDPQLLFDENNQARLAKGLVTCTGDGFRPLIMTFDRVFTARVARAGDCRMGAALSETVEVHKIVPRGDVHGCARLKPDELTLNTYRAAWQADKADPEKIKVFCREARPFMEHTLVDVLAEAEEAVHDHPTLDPLCGRVRNLVKRPGVIQSAEPFKQLLDLLPDGDPAKGTLAEALNWSNHFQAEYLTQAHAKTVDDMLDRFMDLREQCLDILVNRVAPKPVPKAVNANDPVVGAPAPTAKVTVIGLAAASEDGSGPGVDVPVAEAETGDAGGEGEYKPEADLPPVGDQIRTIDPETHQAFGVGQAAKWLPFPLQASSMVICGRGTITPKRGELAVVANRVTGDVRIAWCRMEGSDRVLLAGLAGEFIAAWEVVDCDIYRVMGAVFDGGATDPSPCHPLEKPDLLRNFKHAAEIAAGDSAEPLLKKGDLVLLEPEVRGDTVFSAAEDTVFAVQLSDGRWVIKRVSGPANQPYRLLLPLGMRGAGEVVTTAAGGIGAKVERAFPVAGFLK